MTGTACPACGARPAAGDGVCPACGALLGDEALVYEMDGWEPDEREALDALLDEAAIAHRWEGDDLLVPEEDEERVDDLMDRVEFPDALDAVGEGEDGALDDEAVYAVMSDLFTAADRLAGARVVDVEAAGEMVAAASAAAAAPPPYGVDGHAWARVQELAGGVVAALEAEADDDVVVREAAGLRDVLRHYV